MCIRDSLMLVRRLEGEPEGNVNLRIDLCTATPTSSTEVGVGRPVGTSAATTTGSNPSARRNGLIGPPTPTQVSSRPRTLAPH
eukprot:7423330-Alexandrium_andersonii.AAC.1